MQRLLGYIQIFLTPQIPGKISQKIKFLSEKQRSLQWYFIWGLRGKKYLNMSWKFFHILFLWSSSKFLHSISPSGGITFSLILHIPDNFWKFGERNYDLIFSHIAVTSFKCNFTFSIPRDNTQYGKFQWWKRKYNWDPLQSVFLSVNGGSLDWLSPFCHAP